MAPVSALPRNPEVGADLRPGHAVSTRLGDEEDFDSVERRTKSDELPEPLAFRHARGLRDPFVPAERYPLAA